MKTLNQTPAKDRKHYVKIVLNLHKKLNLLNKITKECTAIYPTNINKPYSRRMQNITNDLVTTLVNGYEKPQLRSTLSVLHKKLQSLKLCWEDGQARGLVPCLEKEIVIDIIKQLRREIKEDLAFIVTQKAFSNVEKTEFLTSSRQQARSNSIFVS